MPYGIRQAFELRCEHCSWWCAGEQGEEIKEDFSYEQLGGCTNPLMDDGFPPIIPAHAQCPQFELQPDSAPIQWVPVSDVLDLAAAIDLIECGRIQRPAPEARADLSMFRSVTREGIAYLAQFEFLGVELGIANLTREVAEVLSKWALSEIRFWSPLLIHPGSFDPFRGSTVDFSFWAPVSGLDVSLAEILTTCTGRLCLETAGLTSDVAAILSRRHAETTLRLFGEQGVEVMSQLARYQGNRLDLFLDSPPEKAALDSLCSNPDRYVVYIEGDEGEDEFWWKICDFDEYMFTINNSERASLRKP